MKAVDERERSIHAHNPSITKLSDSRAWVEPVISFAPRSSGQKHPMLTVSIAGW